MRQDPQRAIAYCQPAIQQLITLHSAYEEELDLLVKVGKDGRVLESVLPDGVLPWMEEAARCLKERLDFFPARRNGVNVESTLSWPILVQPPD